MVVEFVLLIESLSASLVAIADKGTNSGVNPSHVTIQMTFLHEGHGASMAGESTNWITAAEAMVSKVVL